ncbi:hypothetical protein HNO88_002480 [Novosphingobium chloroacetimidivorans]|uniref:Uncharacterized protein n=1 Tax=Novosphingobium chloroacetimidivorans TaxID=1428314 RepID=A0A7W7KAC4_9SPHN|nr:hypothetical protein [Novosphingobium chloroacetimidivorans]MBB4859154.1 hypothetical protein [Novosphingobium chloroacetimidivorans]
MEGTSIIRTDAVFLVRLLAQLTAVTLLVCVALLMVNEASFWSRWNLLWVAGIPFAVSHAFNRDARRRAIMGFCLIPWSLVSIFVGIASFAIEP